MFENFETWYDATAQRDGAVQKLTQNISADVCVVGAGLAGLTTALELSRRGLKVVVLEKNLIGSGASGRNGGFVSSGFALGMDDVVRHVGLDAAHGLYDLSREGVNYVRLEVSPTDIMGKGLLLTTRYDDRGELHRYGAIMTERFGENVQSLNVEDTRKNLVTDRYHESLLFGAAFHIHPLRYCLTLSAKARAAGVQIFENSGVVSSIKSGAGFVVKTLQGEVRAQHAVHCVSASGREVHKPSGRAVLPVATYIAVTKPLVQNAIVTRAAIADTRRAGDYYRVVDEGRILWGGRITTQVSPPTRLAERMKGDMIATYPALGNPRIDYAWSGVMGYALHKMPLIGRDQEGQWFATAFGGQGLNTTAMAGLILASAIADGDDSYRRFIPFAPKWAYGQLGRLGVQGSYWLMQLRDKRDESRLFSPR
jgi:gamma-glutamylputrescine oxidase